MSTNNLTASHSRTNHKLHLAVLAALPMLVMGVNAYAAAGACTDNNGVVTCAGAFSGGSTGGAIMVVPSKYPVPDGTEPASTSSVGYSSKNNFSIGQIGSMSVSVPKFSILNIGSGSTSTSTSTSPTYGVAPDSLTTVVTGLKAVPGFNDIFNGGTAPAIGDTIAMQAAKLVNAKPLVNFEGVDIQQAGTVNNFGVITNTSVGNNITPVLGNTFLVTNGPKVYTEGGADNLAYRTIGVFVNGTDAKLNNYGIINVGINNGAIANSQPGLTLPANMYTTLSGTPSTVAFSETFYDGLTTATCSSSQNTGICLGHTNTTYTPALGTIKTLVTGTNKPVLYAVASTADGDDFYQNVRINNYNKIGAYNFTTGTVATVVGIEVKENITDTHVFNAAGAVIEGVSSQLVAGTGRSSIGTVTNGVGSNTYGTSTGGVQAIGTDNNAFKLFVDNFGTIQSTNVDGTVHGTAIGSSTGEMYLTNYSAGRILGDITVGKSENKFVFTNAGILTGNIVITPDTSSLTPQDCAANPTGACAVAGSNFVDVKTAGNVVNQIVIQPVIQKAGGGNTVAEVGQITGGVYVATGTGTHPFELDVQPVVASGVTVKSGDTYQFSANNISVQSGAKGTPNNSDGTAGLAAVQIDNTNIKVLSSALVHWDFVTGTTNQVAASVANVSSISGLSGNGQNALNALFSSSSPLAATVQNFGTADAVRRSGESILPEANNASTQAAMSAANQVSSVIGLHQDQVRTASNGKSGVSTGEAAQGIGFWMQGFGFKGDQNQRGGVDGYSASTGGFVFGGDSAIGNGDFRLGAALAYASTTVDGQGTTSANRTNINSYQGNVYGSWSTGTWYVDGALGYGQHQYKTKRYVALAGANMSGNHDADQYSAKIGVGYPMAMGKVILTPLAALSYVHLDQAGYSETDATNSGAALTIGNTKTDSFRSGLGAKASLPLSTGTVKTALEARAIWNHEFADTNQDIAARFVGGTSFTTNGLSQARDAANLGLGLTMNSVNGQTFSVNYDADVRSGYFGQTASVKFRYDF